MNDFDNLENASGDDLKATAKGQADIAGRVADHLIVHLSLLRALSAAFPSTATNTACRPRPGPTTTSAARNTSARCPATSATRSPSSIMPK